MFLLSDGGDRKLALLDPPFQVMEGDAQVSQVTDHQIQLGMFIVNGLTFLALIWYAVETMRLRIAARDQVEGLAKPCLTLWADLRDPADSILERHGAVGGTVAQGNAGNFVVQNIGTGVALNVSYYFKSLDSEANRPVQTSYFVNILHGHKVRMPEPMNASTYSGICEVVFQFESIGGRHYQSTVTMNNHVLTAFKFQPV